MTPRHGFNAEDAMNAEDTQRVPFLKKKRSLRRLSVRCVLCVVAVMWPSVTRGQTLAVPKDVAVSPIECWWKTDRSAIRVGEHFQLTLTCAVLDTDKVKVVVDESSLAPSALHLVPFEIIGGNRFRDIRNSPRRFFQYAY